MELRFITFSSLIHNNLMPWLVENQDPQKFRLILRKLAIAKPGDTAQFFATLNVVLNDLGINHAKKLLNEWEMFAGVKTHPELKFIKLFLQLADADPKILFYNTLIANTVAAGCSFIVNQMAESQTDTLRKHRIMSSMKAISDLIITARTLKPTAEIDSIIMERLLAGLSVMYCEIMDRFPEAIEPHILKVCMADIKDILFANAFSDSRTLNLYNALSGFCFPVSLEHADIQVTTCAEMSTVNVRKQTTKSEDDQHENTKLMDEIVKAKNEISGIKDAVAAAIKKKETRPGQEDRWISSSEACVLLDICKTSLNAHRKKNLYKFRQIGSRYYYSANHINELLKAKKM